MKIKKVLAEFITEEIMLSMDRAKLDPDEALIESGILDSFGLMRLIAFIEEQFGIEIDDNEVVPANFQSLNVIESFLTTKLPAN